MTLETQLTELDALVTKLEDESTNLDQAFDYYKEALTITEKITQKLDAFKTQFTVLEEQHDQLVETLQPFDSPEAPL